MRSKRTHVVWLVVALVVSAVAIVATQPDQERSELKKRVLHRYKPDGDRLIVHTNYPSEDFRTTKVSQGKRLLFKCGAQIGQTWHGYAHSRDEIHRSLGPPLASRDHISIWKYPNITDVYRDWKPHAGQDYLVVYFEHGLSTGVETDRKTITEILAQLSLNEQESQE